MKIDAHSVKTTVTNPPVPNAQKITEKKRKNECKKKPYDWKCYNCSRKRHRILDCKKTRRRKKMRRLKRP